MYNAMRSMMTTTSSAAAAKPSSGEQSEEDPKNLRNSATTTATEESTSSSTSLSPPPSAPPLTYDPPPLFVHQHLDPTTQQPFLGRHGHRVLHALPALMDPAKYTVEQYQAQLFNLLSEQLQLHAKADNSQHKVVVLLDLRPGAGWANPPALTLVGWIRTLVKELQGQFPQALHQLLLYPLPKTIIRVYNMCIKPLLRHLSAEVILVPGIGVGTDAPMPIEALSEHVPEAALRVMEEYRLSQFVLDDDNENLQSDDQNETNIPNYETRTTTKLNKKSNNNSDKEETKSETGDTVSLCASTRSVLSI